MKVAKKYVMYFNHQTQYVFYGRVNEYGKRIALATIGFVYECTFTELKQNLKTLTDKGYLSIKVKF